MGKAILLWSLPMFVIELFLTIKENIQAGYPEHEFTDREIIELWDGAYSKIWK